MKEFQHEQCIRLTMERKVSTVGISGGQDSVVNGRELGLLLTGNHHVGVGVRWGWVPLTELLGIQGLLLRRGTCWTCSVCVIATPIWGSKGLGWRWGQHTSSTIYIHCKQMSLNEDFLAQQVDCLSYQPILIKQ